MNSNKDIAVMLKEAGILFAITLLSGLILGFVYELTKEPIRIQEERAIQEACSEVFESAAQFEEITYTLSGELSQELTADGVEIGKVEDVLTMPGNDVYVVKGQRSYMIPAVKEFLLDVNVDEGYVKVKLIEGMCTDEN